MLHVVMTCRRRTGDVCKDTVGLLTVREVHRRTANFIAPATGVLEV